MVAIAASTAGLRAIVNENMAPALTTAATVLPVQYAESARTRMHSGHAPAVMAVLIASVTMLAAPRDEPARPARSRTPASTGAATGVEWSPPAGTGPGAARSSGRGTFVTSPRTYRSQ
jgi:hypothetical protein